MADLDDSAIFVDCSDVIYIDDQLRWSSDLQNDIKNKKKKRKRSVANFDIFVPGVDFLSYVARIYGSSHSMSASPIFFYKNQFGYLQLYWGESCDNVF